MALENRYRAMRLGDNHCNENGELEEHGAHVHLKNKYIDTMDEDVLYHFALGTKSHDFKQMFGDVKFVCVGGSPRRMEAFAQHMLEALDIKLPAGQALVNIAGATDRYALFKAGPVLSASHGMGIPSMSIMLHEMLKLLHHAGVYSDVTLYRIGTCGGLGLKPGSVVVTESAVDGMFRPYWELAVLGKLVQRPACLNPEVASELLDASLPTDEFQVVSGKTMCTEDFYEGQARLDGAFCEYTEEDKMAFLKEAYAQGVRNIEMESLCFAAMCHRAGLKGAVACVSLLDRLKGDQVLASREELKAYSNRPQEIVSRVIKKKLGIV